MYGLIMKDIPKFLPNFLVIAVASVLFITVYDQLEPIIVFLSGILLFMVINGSVSISEQIEDRNHGYKLLAALPISNYSIVMVKFLLPLISVAFIITIDLLIFKFLGGPEILYKIGRSFVILLGFASLLATSFIYMATFLFGFSKFMRYFFLSMISLFLLASVVFQFLFTKHILPRPEILIENILHYFENINLVMTITVGLIFYLLLMFITAKIKSIRPTDS